MLNFIFTPNFFGNTEYETVEATGEGGNSQSNSCTIENVKNNIVDSRTALRVWFPVIMMVLNLPQN